MSGGHATLLGIFATAYLAGVTSVSGGILAGIMAFGGLIYYGLDQGLNLGGWYDALSGVGLVLTVILNPEGIVGPVHAKLAERRQRRSPVPASEVLTSAGEPDRPHPVRAAGPTLLSLQGIGVHYGGVIAVEDVSFDVAEGTIVGLIGPNGAGKTTLIDAVSGFTRCAGTVTLAGKVLDGMPRHRRTHAGLGPTFQAMELWDDLTVGENIVVGLSTGVSGLTVGSTLEMLGLESVQDRPVSELSQGQRQLVSIGRALVGNPKLLLLDEPAAGLDSTESLWLGERLRAVRDRGVTILLVDHDMGLVLTLCDEVQVLNFGKIISSGPPEVIRADTEVTEAYLGSTHSQYPAAVIRPGAPRQPALGGRVTEHVSGVE